MNNSNDNVSVLKQSLSLDETIFQKTIYSSYKVLPPSVFATIIIAAFTISVLWQVIDATLLITWFSFVIVINLARYAAYKYYFKSESNVSEPYFWDRLFTMLVILNGLCFSGVSIFLMPDSDSVYHYFPVMILTGMSAGAVSSLSFRMRNINIYLILFLFPVFVVEILIGSFISYSVAMLTFLLMAFALSNAKRFSQTAIENITLNYQSEKDNQELIESRNIAIEASNAKSNFMSMISHELRTPLNAILGFGQLLKMSDSPPLNTEQEDQTQGIVDSGKHLLSLIDELLDLSKIDSHKIKLDIERVSLSDVINESIGLMQAVAAVYSINIINDVNDTYLVNVDPKRLKQIFINLISNAIKYNLENGTVTIHLEEAADSTIKILITDTGRGLTAEQIEGLYEPFQRYDNKKEGIGLGLYITKNLVELMNGKIGIESEVGKGSTFWFEFMFEEKI